MTIALTPEQEKRLKSLQAAGMQAQPNQLINAALDLLELNQMRLGDLNAELQMGIDDANAGRFKTYSSDTSQNLIADIKRRAAELKR